MLTIRTATPDDMNFVRATWANSYAYTVRDRRRAQAVQELRSKYLEPIMKANPDIVVLCSSDMESTLHGHGVALNGVLAWVYVTNELRGFGYARKIIESLTGHYDQVPVHWKWPRKSTRFIFKEYP